MNRIRKREFPYYYAPGKTLFQVVVKMSDAPGSLDAILKILAPRLNFVGTSTYTLGDGSAMLSCFAESLSNGETSSSLSADLRSSKAVVDVEVREGNDGLLVDSFHTGPEVGGEQFMLISRSGLTHVFSEIVKLLGTGGETVLYTQGYAMGERDANTTIGIIGVDLVRSKGDHLRHVLAAQGWGLVTNESSQGERLLQVRVDDCFECSGAEGNRKQCDFLRGYFEGTAAATLRTKFTSTESKCVLKGDDACVFLLAPAP